MRRYMKSAEQGAATSVYAAVGAEWEGNGALYLSDCQVQGEFRGTEPLALDDEGWARWAFDEGAEEELWRQSLRMVGLEAK
jgi:hypothetical protein